MSGEAVRGLVKSRVEFPRGFAARKFPRGLRRGGNMAALLLACSRIPPATQAILRLVTNDVRGEERVTNLRTSAWEARRLQFLKFLKRWGNGKN